jgi:hypothetical protein
MMGSRMRMEMRMRVYKYEDAGIGGVGQAFTWSVGCILDEVGASRPAGTAQAYHVCTEV